MIYILGIAVLILPWLEQCRLNYKMMKDIKELKEKQGGE